MTDFTAARLQMALSLGFHIVFASIGIAMPFLMAVSHWLYLKSNDRHYRLLTKAWSKGVAIFFAVGAVSGTALSFELGLLWPKFMQVAGPIFGMPFSWEGTAFFLEAIALGIFLYGWDRVAPWLHWASGVCVGIAGVASGIFVICANAWMNSPAGFVWNAGSPVEIDPWAAMFNDAWLIQGIHMIVAAFEAVGFAVAGVHAWLWLKLREPIHEKALRIAFLFGAAAALVQPVIGDFAAKSVARRQPIKLAAMEALEKTQTRAPLRIAGIEIPGALSFLAFGDVDAEVKGLDQVPADLRPPVKTTHFAFQLMVILGTVLAGVSLYGIATFRTGLFLSKRFLRVLALCTPLGFLAIEAGWVVTEVGRQPWILYGLMKTTDALTPRTGIVYTLLLYALLYLLLAGTVVFLMIRQTKALHREVRR